MYQKLLTISQKIVEWKKEEEEIGRDKSPIYETIQTLLPDIEKQRTIDFINGLLSYLRSSKKNL